MDTQNRRLFDGAVKVATFVKFLVGIAFVVGIAWATLGAKVTQLERDVATKQSKEVADGQRDVIITRIESLLDRIEAVEKRFDERERAMERRGR